MAVNILLLTGLLEHLLSRHPERVRLSWGSAYSLIPGRVVLHDVVLEGQTPGTQYRLEVDSGRVRVGLLALLGRRFLAQDLAASGISFQLRKQRIPGEEPRPGQAFEPALEDLPEVRPELKVFERSALVYAPWRIDLRRVRASKIREIWLGPYRCVGEGELSGSMRLKMRGPLEIPQSRLTLQQVSSFVGTRLAGEGLELDLEARLDEMIPYEQRGLESLAFLSGSMMLGGQVADFGFLNALFEGLPQSRFSGGGALDLVLRLERGRSLPGSHFHFSSEALGFHLRDVALRGRGEADAIVRSGDPSARIKLEASLSGLVLEVAGESEPLLGPELSIEAEARVGQLTEGFRDLAMTIDLPESVLSDLAGLGRGLPDAFPLSTLPGSAARLRAHLEIAERSASGVLEIAGHEIGATIGGMPVHGDFQIHGDLGAGSTPAAGLYFPVLALRVDRVRGLLSSQERFSGWWAEGEFLDSRLTLGTPMTVDGAASLRIRDAVPLIDAFVPEGQPRRLAALFGGSDMLARAQVQLDEEGLGLEDVTLKASGLGRGLFGDAGFDLNVEAASLDLERGFRDLDLDLRLPPAQLPDLREINSFLPAELGVRFLPGERGSLEAHLHLQEGRIRGRASLGAARVRLKLPRSTVTTDLGLELNLADSDFFGRTLDVSGSVLRLDELSLPGAELRPGWWADIALDEAQVQIGSPLQLSALMRLRMRDTVPLTRAFAEERGWGLRLAHLFTVEDLSARAGLELREGDFFFKNVLLEGHGNGNGALEGPGYSLVARSSRVDLSRGFESLELALDLAPSRLRDLAIFNEYLPRASGLAFHPGSAAEVEARLKLHDGVAVGQALVMAGRVGVELGRVAARGDLELELNLVSGDLESQRFNVDGSCLRIGNAELMDLPDPAGHGPWNMEALVSRGRAELTRPLRLNADIELSMSDSRPLAQLFARGRDDRWLADLLDFRDVELSAGLELSESKVRLHRLDLGAAKDPGSSLFGAPLRLEAAGSEIDLGEGLEGLDLRVEMPRSDVTDLSVLNRYLPESETLSFLGGGSAWVEGLFSLSSGEARGEFRLAGEGVRARVFGEELNARVGLEGRISSGDWREEGFSLEGFTLDLDSVEFPAPLRIRENWKGRITLSDGRVRLGEPIHASADLRFSMEDSSPLVSYLARSSWWVRRLRHWLLVPSIQGQAKLALDARGFSVDDFRLTGDALDLRARVLLDQGRNSGVAYARLHRLALGIAFDGKRRRYKIFGPLKWYLEHVAELGDANQAR